MNLAFESRYHPNTEQLSIATTVSEALRELLPLSRLHASHQESTATWDSLEDIGIFGIGVREALGGSGLGAVEEALIVMQLGARLASPAILATVASAPICEEIAALESRRTAAAYRQGGRCILVAEAEAALILLRDLGDATLYRWPATALRAIDDRLWLSSLCEVAEVGEPLVRFNERQLSRLRLIEAAALSGMAQATLEMSVEHARTREQFGRPIGSFQAVKHHCANMAMAARCARDQTNFAAVALDEERSDALLQVECALFVAGSAAIENAGKNIQIHGGIGFSDEAHPHLFLKRAQLQIAIAGGLEAANYRIANAKADC